MGIAKKKDSLMEFVKGTALKYSKTASENELENEVSKLDPAELQKIADELSSDLEKLSTNNGEKAEKEDEKKDEKEDEKKDEKEDEDEKDDKKEDEDEDEEEKSAAKTVEEFLAKMAEEEEALEELVREAAKEHLEYMLKTAGIDPDEFASTIMERQAALEIIKEAADSTDFAAIVSMIHEYFGDGGPEVEAIAQQIYAKAQPISLNTGRPIIEVAKNIILEMAEAADIGVNPGLMLGTNPAGAGEATRQQQEVAGAASVGIPIQEVTASKKSSTMAKIASFKKGLSKIASEADLAAIVSMVHEAVGVGGPEVEAIAQQIYEQAVAMGGDIITNAKNIITKIQNAEGEDMSNDEIVGASAAGAGEATRQQQEVANAAAAGSPVQEVLAAMKNDISGLIKEALEETLPGLVMGQIEELIKDGVFEVTDE
jgi:hypothetical protein